MLELTTARADLRPFAPGDAPELLSLFRNEGVRRYLLDDVLVEREWVDQEIAESERRFAEGGAGLWAVRLASRGEVMGFVGFREFFEPPQLQLLYGLHPDYWGLGLATEVAAAICRFAFKELGFEEIVAAIDTPHDASRAVLGRLAFRETHRTTDTELGTTFFRLTRFEWAVPGGY